MLSDRLCRLLTAYVDGELDSRQQKAVVQLLRSSAEARAFLGQLQQDAEQLRQLPRRVPAQDLSERVLQAIAEDRLPCMPRRPAVVVRSSFPAWTGLAAAAAVLLVVGTSSYLYFASAHLEQVRRAAIAKEDAVPELLPEPHSPAQVVILPGSEAKPPTIDANPPQLPAPAAPALAQGPTERSPTPEIKSPEGTPRETRAEEHRFGIPLLRLEMFQEVADPRLALILPVRELDQEKPKQRLHDELKKDTAYRMELGCQESTRAFERLQAAFQEHGVRLIIDQDARDRLNLRLKTNFVLYTENLTPEELVQVMLQLGQDDKRAEVQHRGEGQFDKLVLNRMTPEDHKELSKLLGVDPTQIQPARPQTPLGVDIRKPLAVETAEQVVQALKGQGTPRPEPGKAVGKDRERLAIVLAYNPVRPRPASSKEVKQFLDHRKDPRPATIQLLLVLRGKYS